MRIFQQAAAIARRESKGKVFVRCSLEVRALCLPAALTPPPFFFFFTISPHPSLSIKAFFPNPFHWGVACWPCTAGSRCKLPRGTPPALPRPCNAPRAQLISVRAAGHGQTPGPRVAKRQRDLLQGLQQALNQALTAPCILSGWCFHMWLALTKLLLEI